MMKFLSSTRLSLCWKKIQPKRQAVPRLSFVYPSGRPKPSAVKYLSLQPISVSGYGFPDALSSRFLMSLNRKLLSSLLPKRQAVPRLEQFLSSFRSRRTFKRWSSASSRSVKTNDNTSISTKNNLYIILKKLITAEFFLIVFNQLAYCNCSGHWVSTSLQIAQIRFTPFPTLILIQFVTQHDYCKENRQASTYYFPDLSP